MNFYDCFIVILIAISIQHVGQIRESCERWFHYKTPVGKAEQTLSGLPHQAEQGEEPQAEASERREVGGLQGEAQRVDEKGPEGAESRPEAKGAESRAENCPHCGAEGRAALD